MENKKLLRKTALNYGLYMALVSMALSAILYVSGMYDLSGQGSSRWVGFVSGLVITVVFVILAYNKYKQEGDGFLNFGEGWRLSFTTIVYSIIISLVWLVVYMFVLEPNYQEAIIQAQYDQLEARGLEEGSEGFEMAISWTEKMTSPVFMFVWTIVNGSIFGAILSLIMAAFFKKKRDEFPVVDSGND